jgi:hypothetical protein
MTAVFVPDQGSAGHNTLVHPSGGPSGWSAYPQSGVTTAIGYTYLAALGAGASAQLSDGTYVVQGETVATQQGTMRFSFTAPELQPVVQDVPVVAPPKVLTLDPGQSQTSATTFDEWDLNWAGAGLTVGGANIPAGALSLTVTFVPTDPPVPPRTHPLYRYSVIPEGWTTTTPAASAVDTIVYTTTAAVPAGTVLALEGTWFRTSMPAWSVPGAMRTTFASAGFIAASKDWPTSL